MSLGTYSTTTSMQVKMVGTVFDTATTALASALLVDSSDMIRQRLSKRYDFTATTFQTTTTFPPLIKTICENWAVGMMYQNMSRGGKEGMARGAALVKMATDSIDLLSIGDAELIDPNGNVIDQITTDWKSESNTSGYANTFNEDDPKHWRPDSTKLEDISDERPDTGDDDDSVG